MQTLLAYAIFSRDIEDVVIKLGLVESVLLTQIRQSGAFRQIVGFPTCCKAEVVSLGLVVVVDKLVVIH